MKITELAKQLKTNRADVLALLQDLKITVTNDEIADNLAKEIIGQLQPETPKEQQLPPQKEQVNTQPKQGESSGLESIMASAGYQSGLAIDGLFKAVDQEAESIANLITAQFVSRFSQTMSNNQIQFTELYMRGLAHRMDEIKSQIESQIKDSENFIQSLPQPQQGKVIGNLLPSIK